MREVLALALAVALIATAEATEPPRWPTYEPAPKLDLGERTLTLTLEVVPDADVYCRKLGVAPAAAAGPTGRLIACAEWDSESCRVIVEPNVSTEMLGHEARHCLQGRFHAD